MKYIIYKTINLINGKYYVGKHQTNDLNDVYLGSGKVLSRAIQKYGKENFYKEILYCFDQEWKMNLRERILVVPDKELNYNLNEGGKGGFSYINKNYKELGIVKGVDYINLHGLNNNGDNHKKATLALQEKWKSNTVFRMELSEKLSTILKNSPNNWTGRKHSEESKQKISSANKGKKLGDKNPSFGTCWITKDNKNRKIKINDLNKYLKEGYVKGRKINPRVEVGLPIVNVGVR